MQTLTETDKNIAAAIALITTSRDELKEAISAADLEKEATLQNRLVGLERVLQRYEGERADLQAREAAEAAQQERARRVSELVALAKTVNAKRAKVRELASTLQTRLSKPLEEYRSANTELRESMKAFWTTGKGVVRDFDSLLESYGARPSSEARGLLAEVAKSTSLEGVNTPLMIPGLSASLTATMLENEAALVELYPFTHDFVKSIGKLVRG